MYPFRQKAHIVYYSGANAELVKKSIISHHPPVNVLQVKSQCHIEILLCTAFKMMI